MSLRSTPSGERVHIAFFGMRNAGKSSLVNAVTGQKVSLVSPILGTTTDPVKKAMELLPMGPVEIIDTPGFDDVGELGTMRVERTREILRRTDLAVLVVDSRVGLRQTDKELRELFSEQNIPYVIAYTKCDEPGESVSSMDNSTSDRGIVANTDNIDFTKVGSSIERSNVSVADVPVIYTSTVTGIGIRELKETLAHMRQDHEEKSLLGGILKKGDVVILVMPQDESAPKGRLILPQQMVIREVLEAHALPICCQTQELSDTLAALKELPALVITDSQVFHKVAPMVPTEVALTSFSILFARYKGELTQLMGGVGKLKELKEAGEERRNTVHKHPRILISEGCTHHRQCGDIGTVKLPRLIRTFTGTEPEFHFTSGNTFPEDLFDYDLVVHCGACMLGEKEMKSRLGMVGNAKVPIVNYGIAIAYMQGILKRSLEIFPEIYDTVFGETTEGADQDSQKG